MRALLLLGGLAACPAKPEKRHETVETVAAEQAPQALPARAADGAIAPELGAVVWAFDAADDGGWVALCERTPEGSQRATLVVGDGAGLPIDRLIATSARDLVYSRAKQLFHVDVVARTVRALGPLAPVAIDAASRRVVVARGERVVVHDPGAAPREVPAGVPITALSMRHRRVATVGTGYAQDHLTGTSCYPPFDVNSLVAERRAVDLDPSGVEAIERVGPAIGVTAAGEITVDGTVVVDARCAGHVIAALATPPRVLAICAQGHGLLAGPDFGKKVDIWLGYPSNGTATIAPQVALGQRVPCLEHACVDLISGLGFERKQVVWSTDRVVVLTDEAGLRIHHLPAHVAGQPPGEVRTLTVALPRVVQTVTLDAVTGSRQVGAAPVPPRFIDAAGRWLLFGRHVIDVQDGVHVSTLNVDADAIDELGRVLVRPTPGRGPLRWVKPS